MAKFLKLESVNGRMVIVAIDKILGIIEQGAADGRSECCAILVYNEVIYVKNPIQDIEKVLAYST